MIYDGRLIYILSPVKFRLSDHTKKLKSLEFTVGKNSSDYRAKLGLTTNLPQLFPEVFIKKLETRHVAKLTEINFSDGNLIKI